MLTEIEKSLLESIKSLQTEQNRHAESQSRMIAGLQNQLNEQAKTIEKLTGYVTKLIEEYSGEES